MSDLGAAIGAGGAGTGPAAALDSTAPQAVSIPTTPASFGPVEGGRREVSPGVASVGQATEVSPGIASVGSQAAEATQPSEVSPLGVASVATQAVEVCDTSGSATTLDVTSEPVALCMTVPKVLPPSQPSKTEADAAARLAELEARCQLLQDSLSAKEQESAQLTHRVRDLEATAVRAARELERKERQVGELSVKGAELTQQLAERENEVSAYSERAARLEREAQFHYSMLESGGNPLSARTAYSNTQVLSSPADEDDHLGNANTLAALRQRLYRQHDAVLAADAGGERFAPVGDVYATAGTGGSGGGGSEGAGVALAYPDPSQRYQEEANARIQSRRLSGSARNREPQPVETTIRLHSPRRPTATWGVSG